MFKDGSLLKMKNKKGNDGKTLMTVQKIPWRGIRQVHTLLATDTIHFFSINLFSSLHKFLHKICYNF